MPERPSRLRPMPNLPVSGSATAGAFRLDHDIRKRQAAEACARLIATRGYAETSIRDVAGEVGISTGTLLHHFGSKDQLLTATLILVSEAFMDRMRAATARTEGPVQRLRAVVRSLLARSPEADLGWRVWIAFWHEAAIKPDLASVASAMTDESENFIAAIIAEGVEKGLFNCARPQESAAELAALIDGVAIRLYGETGRWSHERARKLVDNLIDDWTIATNA